MQGSKTNVGCALVLLALAGCGGDKPAPNEPTPSATGTAPNPAAPPSPAPAPAPVPSAEAAKPDDAGVVHLSAGDLMRFSATRIEVKVGKAKIELKNLGALPKEVMGHDLIVLKPGADVTAFAAKAMNAKATDYIPADGTDQMIAHTRLLGPGESQTIEFDVLAGSYPFLCTFPGHVGLMNGLVIVE